MTSFILRSVQDRPDSYPPQPHFATTTTSITAAPPSTTDPDCTFCRIVKDKSKAWVVYEDQDVLAFLDIYPMRPGHTLLIPKHHTVRLADLSPELGGKMGGVLPRVVRAVCEATGNPDLNVVCNQGYAQAVHVHWHLIPAPTFSSIPPITATNTSTTSDPVGDLPSKKPKRTSKSTAPPTHKFMLRGEMAYRDFLDDDEAEGLVREIKSRL